MNHRLLTHSLLLLLSSLTATITHSAEQYGKSNNNSLDLPTIGHTSSTLVSIEQERKLGEAWLRSLLGQVKTFSNPVIEEYLTQLIYTLAPYSNVVDKNFSLVMVDSPALNAFAVPGSVVGVNAGLFIHAFSEQEFTSVIAHELAHLGQRHYARQLEQQALSTPLTLAGILASVVIAATTGSDAGIAALAATQAMSVENQLGFSRQNEQEADRLGIATMYNAGFNPREMPVMFERMYRQTRIQGGNIPEYLSTHPLSESRISDTRNRATQYKLKQYTDNIEYHISKNMIISEYAESKKSASAYFNSIIKQGNTNQVNAANFGLAYAQLESSPTESIKILEQLITNDPTRISYIVTYAKALSYNKQNKLALATLKTALERNPDNYPILDSLAEIYLNNDMIQESEKALKKLVRKYPLNARLWYSIAEVHGLAGNIVSLHQARAEYFFLTNHLDNAIKQLKLAMQKSNDNQQNASLIQKRMDEIYWVQKNPVF
jgi:predicted Zn-dependent protease